MKLIFNFLVILTILIPSVITAKDSYFAPKFGKPPAKNAKKRINVTISTDKGRLLIVPQTPQKATGKAIPFDWFWGVIPAKDRNGILHSDFDKAIASIKSNDIGASVTPSVSALNGMIGKWNAPLLRAGAQHGVSPALLASVMWVESRGQQKAISHAGAQGLMQLIPATAERFGVTDAFDPAANIAGSAAYLRWLLDEFKGDPILALASYNAGENAIKSAGGVPNYAETRAYVPKVLAAYCVARLLCKTPPVLVTDGCIFQLPASN